MLSQNVIVLAVLLLAAVMQSATAKERPNVLFVIADDLGIGDLGCYGNGDLDTPKIDGLAEIGVRLTDHYAPSPLCAPSRAGFLTGRFNHRTGAVDVPSNRGLDRIVLSEKTFGDYFQGAGYATAMIGKWHNGLYCRDYLPHQRGFDLFYGFPNGGQDYWRWNLMRNDQHVVSDGRYLSDVLNDEAIQFVRNAKASNNNFAVFLAHHAPHFPLQAPDELVQKYVERLGPKVSKNVAVIYAMIEAMDTGLGRLFQVLRELGLWKNTIVVFTSDNGAQLGKYNGQSTERFHGGLSGNKGDVGEQGIRVPGIVVWANRIVDNRVESTPVHGCDWLPTLLSACEIPVSDEERFDGRNVLPMLLGRRQSSLNSRSLPFQKNRYRPAAYSDASIRRGRWKLMWPPVPITMKKDSGRDNPSYLRGVIKRHWEMPLDRELGPVPVFEDPSPRLFDLEKDPGEESDLAAMRPNVVEELSRDYDRWFADVLKDWQGARQEILDHDREYWQERESPNAAELFKDFWQWRHAKGKVDPTMADPLKVFRGYWE